MAKPLNQNEKDEIRDVVAEHSRGPYVWGRRDCLTLIERVLDIQGVIVDFRRVDPDLYADTHEEAMRLGIAKHGSAKAMFEHHLDGIGGLERADSPYEWEAGMVGITPDEGTYLVGLSRVDAAKMGSMLGIVDHRVRPGVFTLDKGFLPVSKLWPRWKPRLTLTGG